MLKSNIHFLKIYIDISINNLYLTYLLSLITYTWQYLLKAKNLMMTYLKLKYSVNRTMSEIFKYSNFYQIN